MSRNSPFRAIMQLNPIKKDTRVLITKSDFNLHLFNVNPNEKGKKKKFVTQSENVGKVNGKLI